jgi:hypothetical protein
MNPVGSKVTRRGRKVDEFMSLLEAILGNLE